MRPSPCGGLTPILIATGFASHRVPVSVPIPFGCNSAALGTSDLPKLNEWSHRDLTSKASMWIRQIALQLTGAAPA